MAISANGHNLGRVPPPIHMMLVTWRERAAPFTYRLAASGGPIATIDALIAAHRRGMALAATALGIEHYAASARARLL
jgi:hypothetical protein